MRRGGETDLVVHHDVHRAASSVAAQAGEAQNTSATTPWPAKAASPCSRIGMTCCALLIVELVLLGADLAQTTGLTASRCEGFAVSEGAQCCRQIHGQSCAKVIFYVAQSRRHPRA